MRRPPQIAKPRDLGLVLWFLLHRIPVDVELTENAIEAARLHCHMSPERLREVRSDAYSVHWRRMMEKRSRRFAYFQKHGSIPAGWTPVAPGEQDRTPQILAMRRYRNDVAPGKSKMRRYRAGKDSRFTAWLAMKLARSRNIVNRQKRVRILRALEARLLERVAAERLTPIEQNLYRELKKADQKRTEGQP